MPQYTENFTEIHEPLNYMIYQVLSPGDHYSPYVCVSGYHRVYMYWFVGNMGPASDMLVVPYVAQDAAGTNAAWLPWHWTFAYGGMAGEQTHHAIEFPMARMPQGYQYVAMNIVVNTSPVEFTGFIWGVCPRHVTVPAGFWTAIATT